MQGVLAINGGGKAVTAPCPHFLWPQVTEATIQAVLEQLKESISIYDRSGIIATLEQKLAAYHGRKHALLTSSGTAALHSMFMAANFRGGDEVICPAYTFFASVSPLLHTEATVVLADCGDDGNIDCAAVENLISQRTRAILVTHMWGLPCDMRPMVQLANRHDLLLFEDGSHAHGARRNGVLVGAFGDAAAFSLQGQKTLTGGEGGFLLTDNDELFYRALAFGHYNKRCKQEIPLGHELGEFAVTGMGLKFRIHPIAAAIANQQLDVLPEVLSGRRGLAKRLIETLRELQCLTLPNPQEGTDPSWYAFVMQYDASMLAEIPIGRFHAALRAEGCWEVDRPGSTCPLNQLPLFQTPHKLLPSYKGKIANVNNAFPKAEQFHRNALKLPVWHRPTDNKLLNQYAAAFHKVVNNHRELMR